MNDAEIEAAVRAELPWLLERRQPGKRAAAEDTVSGRLRRAVKHMRQPYEQICQATGIPFEQLAGSGPSEHECRNADSWKTREANTLHPNRKADRGR
jgi:hypothetical protein